MILSAVGLQLGPPSCPCWHLAPNHSRRDRQGNGFIERPQRPLLGGNGTAILCMGLWGLQNGLQMSLKVTSGLLLKIGCYFWKFLRAILRPTEANRVAAGPAQPRRGLRAFPSTTKSFALDEMGHRAVKMGAADIDFNFVCSH